jgi:hypothetical protein
MSVLQSSYILTQLAQELSQLRGSLITQPSFSRAGTWEQGTRRAIRGTQEVIEKAVEVSKVQFRANVAMTSRRWRKRPENPMAHVHGKAMFP